MKTITDWGVRDQAGGVTWVRQGEDAAREYAEDRHRMGFHAQLVTRTRTEWEDA